ncbi:MAG: hypothetical protein ACTHOD_11395 [Motilibacteraceae bacterium]
MSTKTVAASRLDSTVKKLKKLATAAPLCTEDTSWVASAAKVSSPSGRR